MNIVYRLQPISINRIGIYLLYCAQFTMKILQRASFMQLVIGLLAHLNEAQTIKNDLFQFPFTHSTIDDFAGYHLKACCFEV